MNGQMNNYKNYLKKSYTPISVDSLHYFLDMKALANYAKSKNVKISDLSKNEKFYEKFFALQNCLCKAYNGNNDNGFHEM